MLPSGEEDFSTLLDLDLDINFPSFDSNGEDASNHVQASEAGHNTRAQQQPFQSNSASGDGAYDPQQFIHIPSEQQHVGNGMRPQQHMQNMNVMPSSSSGFPSMNTHPQYGQQQQSHSQQFHDTYGIPFPPQQQQSSYNHGVPHTPNSMDMQGDTGKYLTRMDPQTRAAMQQRYQLRTDDPMSFTPLVSPAVTPRETSFQIPPEFPVTGAYFSPLTSPMLEAQRNSQRSLTSNPRSTASPAATSPADPDVEMLDASTEGPAKKSRKKASNSGPRSVVNAARARQSPMSKGQRKRGTTSGVISSKEASGMISERQRFNNAITARPSSAAGLNPGYAQDSSEADSISPEPLSESVMRPPPKPTSKTQSPAILPQNQSGAPSHLNDSIGSPATPASLMRIQQQQQQDNGTNDAANPSEATQQVQQIQPAPEEFSLPEAAKSTRPRLPNIDTSASPANDQPTPRVSAKDTSASGSLYTGTPTAINTGASMKLSPRALRSPTATVGGGKADGKNSRSSKKRNSSSSTLVSPALRPKISPNIKPLLPEGANLTDEHHALLLASKSNYQNLLDGTRLPGVNYPQELSTNLTSKRTSHKIAEQGRRNRINTALQEMQSLLPGPQSAGPSTPKDVGGSKSPPAAAATIEEGVESGTIGGSNGGGKANGSGGASASAQSNSKAATVESAIEYIKQLKREATEREHEIAELKARLGRTSSSASPQVEQTSEEGKECDGSMKV
ncbi:MAG: hypothetical protein M1822_008064 [Bathelium mastoideum]|nr:MAG: hypothetical protein M1822_008064 [Bathelium mastoideum]